MRGFKVLAAAFGLMIGVLAAVPASAWTRGTVNVLFQLPELEDQPGVRSSVEGIAVRRRDGHVFVATSGFNAGPVAPTGNAYLFEIDPMTGGMVGPQRRIAGSSSNMLGMAFRPVSSVLLIVDSGATPNVVLQADTDTFFPASVFMTLPAGDGANAARLNAITFDRNGNVYVSDSANGQIWTTGPNGGEATVWSTGADENGNLLLFVPPERV